MLFEPQEYENVPFAIEPYVNAQIEKRLSIQQDAGTQICRLFLKGQCTKGDQCQLRHSRGNKSVVCKHWLRGLCKKSDLCEFLHEFDLTKMPPCHFFTTFGKCCNRECPFLHQHPGERVKDCAWFARGFCKHGADCRNRHVRKKPCLRYLVGFCPKGPRCEFGHPRFELPSDHEGKAWCPLICHRCGCVGHRAMNCPKFPLQDEGPREYSGQAPDFRPQGQHFAGPPGGGGGRRGFRDLATVTCFKCRELGHYASHCPMRRPRTLPGGGGDGGGMMQMTGDGGGGGGFPASFPMN